jgi:short subunit dehydrogenase-like uncharacterized protein
MPDVLLFGATGFTGALTAEALGRRGADFVVAGRNLTKLEAVASRTGAADARKADVGDVDGLVRALGDVKALITTVGPFEQLGDTAAEAAVRAGVHYLDSTGETAFLDRLVSHYGQRAAEAGIVMAPAMGFDEVPADVAASLAVDQMAGADLVLTYAMPRRASTGTLRTLARNIATRDARWVSGGEHQTVGTASRSRWAPMPAPLGPKFSVAFPFSIGELAPMHLDLNSLELYGIVSRLQAGAMRTSMPVVKRALKAGPVQGAINALLNRMPDGPSAAARSKDRWSILAEARSGNQWRNVSLSGVDVYGLTAETLAAGALKLAREGHDGAGVLAPVPAIGLDALHKELIGAGVDIQIYEPA